MTVAIAASLIGLPPVQHVQLAVTGIVPGDVVAVWREWDGHSELVRGGVAVTASSTALVLTDIAAPFGVALTYRAQVGVDQVTDTVTVPQVHAEDHVLSHPLTGEYVLVRLRADAPDPRANAFRGSILRPAGRARAVAIYDVRADDAGSWVLRTPNKETTDLLRSLLAYGGPVIHRPGTAGLLDFPGTEVVQFLDVSRSLSGLQGGRDWAVSYEVVDEPDPDVAISLSTLEDLADAYDTLTLDDLATDFVALTLLDVATTDWASL